MRKNLFCTRPTTATKAAQKSYVPARRAQRTNQGKTPSFVLLESPFIPLSTVSRGTPLGVSLVLLFSYFYHLHCRYFLLRSSKLQVGNFTNLIFNGACYDYYNCTQKNFRNACYQVGFCTDGISTGATPQDKYCK